MRKKESFELTDHIHFTRLAVVCEVVEEKIRLEARRDMLAEKNDYTSSTILRLTQGLHIFTEDEAPPKSGCDPEYNARTPRS